MRRLQTAAFPGFAPGSWDEAIGLAATLAGAIAASPGHEITQGEIHYRDQNIASLTPSQRAQKGIFLAFQHPVEIPGLPLSMFLKESVNAIRKAQGESPLDAMEFLQQTRDHMKRLEMDEALLHRCVNERFSGGEKKRAEILHMHLLQPHLTILDETDSGLDVDALQRMARAINTLRSPTRSMLMITHYHTLLQQIKPDRIHIMHAGTVVQSGTLQLAEQVQQTGFEPFQQVTA